MEVLKVTPAQRDGIQAVRQPDGTLVIRHRTSPPQQQQSAE